MDVLLQMVVWKSANMCLQIALAIIVRMHDLEQCNRVSRFVCTLSLQQVVSAFYRNTHTVWL